jgi:hypothetical protein
VGVMRDTTFQEGAKIFSASKVPRQCPLRCRGNMCLLSRCLARITSASAIIPAFRQCLPSHCRANGHIPSHYIYIHTCFTVGARTTQSISDWLRAGRPRGRSSSNGRGRPVQGPVQPPIQWVQRDLSTRIKQPGREADQSGLEYVDLYIHYPVRLHGLVLN